MTNQKQKIVYNPSDIEPKWAKKWEEGKIYKTKKVFDLDKSKKKMHVLDMFPYPSGEGLHTGHAKIFSASDIYARLKRMQGYNVLHATGYDAFGLPAEQYALKNKVNPKISTKKNTENFERQMRIMGFSYDWERTVNTTDPDFYKWTQWIFKQLYKDGLCYESNEPINWCPSCKTGLANEDLENGLCERCGSVVEKKPIRQWVIEITKYAEKLLVGVDNLAWKESIKEMQRNWIGKSVGAEIEFKLKKENTPIRPLYVDDVQPPKTGLKTTQRKAVMILIKHWSEDKYLLNISEKFNWKILFTGGIEAGESVYEATRREVLEETGYKNFRAVKKINFAHTDNFERVHKGDNAVVEQTNMFVELENGDQQEREECEAALHKLEWHTRDEMLNLINRRNHKFVFDFATSGNHSGFENVFVGYKESDFFEVNENFTVFTTRPDTLFGCTYCVFAPEQKIIKEYLDKGLINNAKEVEEYINLAKNKSEIERTALGKEKTGVKLEGIVAVNPANNKEIPVYIADYVLANYGTGAIMAVPDHDERDGEFAKKFGIEMINVVEVPENFDGEFYTEYGVVKNSGKFDGMESEEAKEKITEFVGGKISTKYKLKDWVFARQRYWGEPFPIVFADNLDNLKISEKTFVDNSSVSKVKEELPFVERDAIVAIVKHPSEEKYIGLKWKKVDWGTFVTGGIEKGQTAEIAATEEVRQETGYKNFHKILNLGLVHSKFFHNPKNENRFAHINIIYIELSDLEKEKIEKSESEIHEVVWLEKNQVMNFLTPEAHKYVFAEILKESHRSYLVADSELPVILPDVESYEPTGDGESPLKNIKDWVEVYGYLNEENEFVSFPVKEHQKKYINKYFDLNIGPGKDAYRKGEEIFERDVAVCLIKHPTEEKFLLNKLNVDGVEWTGFLTGGVEDGDTVENTAAKEVLEESGFKNFREIRNLNFTTHGIFFHPHKKVNRFINLNSVFVQLENLEKEEISDDEKKLHNFVWIDKDEVLEKITRFGIKIHWEKFLFGEVRSENPLRIISAKRETNTMPQWAGSSWYWLRYMDPKNSESFVGSEEEKYWNSGTGVDIYLGGMEHATRHLIYGRFWQQFLYDKGYLSISEPFNRLEAVGLVLGKGGVKMSKRLGNIVNPDDVVKQFGADTLRTYIAFAGDFHDSFAWDEKAIVGPRRFIERVWGLQYKIVDKVIENEVENVLHKTIKKCTEDYEKLAFNTAIAQLMILVNTIEKYEGLNLETYKILLKLLAPIAPYVTEEVWESLGEKESIHLSTWPEFDNIKTLDKQVNMAVQINGKLRDVFLVDSDTQDEIVIELAKSTEGYKKWVGEVTPKKVIVVKNKVVNIVV